VRVERKQAGSMVDSLLNHPRWGELERLGYLKTFRSSDNTFNVPDKVERARLTFAAIIQRPLLYDSQYVPCPSGLHEETEEIWETLEGGAIPVVLKAPENQILEALDVGIVFLRRWSELPQFLLTVTANETKARGGLVRQR
jgi:hypothetical protein